MRTIRVYKVGHRTWLSPSALWQAITSKEDVTIMAHSAGVNIPKALLQAAKHLGYVWKTSALSALSGGLWSLFVAALVTWPKVGTLMISEIQTAIQFVGLLGAVVCGGVIVYSIHGWRKVRNTLFDYPIAIGQKLPAPTEALRQPKYRLPKLSLAIFAIVAVMVLNSVVIATPLMPAVVQSDEPYITNAVVIVLPFTKWEQRSQYPPGQNTTYFAAVDKGEKYWVIQMDYYVYRADILEELDDWDEWLGSVLRWVVDQDTQSVRLSLGTDLTPEQKTIQLVEIVSNPDRLKQLEGILVDAFAERYPTLALRGVHLEVKLLTMAQLRSALDQ